MPVERLGHLNTHPRVDAFDLPNDTRQVPLQMHAEGEEVRDHDDPMSALSDQRLDSVRERRRRTIQERSLGERVVASPGQPRGDGAHRLIGGLDRGTVGEKDDTGHTVRMLGPAGWVFPGSSGGKNSSKK